MSPSFTIIDDRDSSSVTYSGTWSLGGTEHEHSDTVSSSVTPGDKISVLFDGTAISVYGTFDASSNGVRTSYAIDGGPAATVVSPSSGKDSYQQLFWQSNAVPSGSHTLVVKMVSVNRNAGDGEGTVWFDYFNVTSDASTSSSSASASSPSASSVSTTVGKKTRNSALMGGVIAAVVFVIIAAAAFFLLRRKRRRGQGYSAVYSAPSSTQPYLLQDTTYLAGSMRSSEIQSTGKFRSPASSSPSPSSFAPSSFPPPSPAESKRRQHPSAPGGSGAIQHLDSGARALDPAVPAPPVELPPVYTPV
ncbi:hypothetical protein C8R47DRAFT_1329620 [Mycena vitilis]|nr:hypothetical protein C8R47DRAFT_1329620 [Mycena vitilis]